VKTRGELDALLATAANIAVSDLSTIGADNTDTGREVYRPGDRHAVITGNYDHTPYTVCATPAADGPLACKPISVEKTISIEYSDGRYGAGVTPILFEL
jgi:hypothetical protein